MPPPDVPEPPRPPQHARSRTPAPPNPPKRAQQPNYPPPRHARTDPYMDIPEPPAPPRHSRSGRSDTTDKDSHCRDNGKQKKRQKFSILISNYNSMSRQTWRPTLPL